MITVTVVDAAGNPQFVLGAESEAAAEAQFGPGLVHVGSPPDQHHLWDGTQWVLRPLQARLEAARADAWETIKATRQRRLAGSFQYGGNTYQIDPVNISGAALDAREAITAGEAWSQAWVLSDNTVVFLSALEMVALGRACKTAVSLLWETSQYLRGQILQATTPDEALAVSWPRP